MISQPYLRGLDLPLDPEPTAKPYHVPLSELRQFPDISAQAKSHHAKRFGSAAELLCDSILMRLGIDCHPTQEFQAYDRVCYLNERALRLQIKVRLSALNGGFLFTITHGNPRHANGVRGYHDDAFDLLALVVLHQNVIKFSASKAERQRISLSEIPLLQDRPFDSLYHALCALGFDEDGTPAELHQAA